MKRNRRARSRTKKPWRLGVTADEWGNAALTLKCSCELRLPKTAVARMEHSTENSSLYRIDFSFFCGPSVKIVPGRGGF